MSEHPLAKTTVLAHLQVCRWSGEVKDKKAMAMIAQATRADVANDKYLKSLFASHPFADIELIAGRLRNHFYAASLPWLGGSTGRLIPTDRFEFFHEQYLQLREEFFTAVAVFIADYAKHKKQAKELKGELYNEEEYPPVEDLARRFDVILVVLPFPNVAQTDATKELKDLMYDSLDITTLMVSSGIEARFVRRIKMLQKALQQGKRFNVSLLEELNSVIEMGLSLERTLPAKLVQRLKATDASILTFSAEEIRRSSSLREELITICGALL